MPRPFRFGLVAAQCTTPSYLVDASTMNFEKLIRA